MTDFPIVKRTKPSPSQRRVLVCELHIYHPVKLGALRTAHALRHQFEVRFDGFKLYVYAKTRS